MTNFRFHVLKETLNRKPIEFAETQKQSKSFGRNVFNEITMRQYLTKDAYKGVLNAMKLGTKIDRKIADQVASSMKEWALSK